MFQVLLITLIASLQDRKPLVKDIPGEDTEFEQQAARLCAELQAQTGLSNDVVKARFTSIYMLQSSNHFLIFVDSSACF